MIQQAEGMKLSSHYEMIENVLNKLPYQSTELMKATAVSAVYHSTDEYGNITHTTMDRLYKHLSDDYEISLGGAESRINTLRKDMFNSLSPELTLEIFGCRKKIPNYIFIIELSKYVVKHW